VAVPIVTGSTYNVREYPQWWVPMIVGSNGECLSDIPLAGFQWPSRDGWRSACVFRLRISRESMLFS